MQTRPQYYRDVPDVSVPCPHAGTYQCTISTFKGKVNLKNIKENVNLKDEVLLIVVVVFVVVISVITNTNSSLVVERARS